jgi:hypothetical protein
MKRKKIEFNVNFNCVQFPIICILLLFVTNDIVKFLKKPDCTLYSLITGIIPLIYLIAMLGLSLGNPSDPIPTVQEAGIADFINVKGWHHNSDQEKRTVINGAGACFSKTVESMPKMTLENSWRGKVAVSVFVFSEVINRTIWAPLEKDVGNQ